MSTCPPCPFIRCRRSINSEKRESKTNFTWKARLFVFAANLADATDYHLSIHLVAIITVCVRSQPIWRLFSVPPSFFCSLSSSLIFTGISLNPTAGLIRLITLQHDIATHFFSLSLCVDVNLLVHFFPSVSRLPDLLFSLPENQSISIDCPGFYPSLSIISISLQMKVFY